MDVEMILEIFYTFTRFCAFFHNSKQKCIRPWSDLTKSPFSHRDVFINLSCFHSHIILQYSHVFFFWSILGSFLSFLKEGFFYLLHLHSCCSTFSSFISICLEKGKIWKHFLPIKTVNINNCI